MALPSYNDERYDPPIQILGGSFFIFRENIFLFNVDRKMFSYIIKVVRRQRFLSGEFLQPERIGTHAEH